MSHATRHLGRPETILSAIRPTPRAFRATHRYASNRIRQPRPWAEENVPPVDPRPAWFFPVSRFSNYVIIPGTLLYAVFFADFGDKEHVFMPARRWLDRQKAAFFSLTDAEREIAGTGDEAAEGTGARQD